MDAEALAALVRSGCDRIRATVKDPLVWSEAAVLAAVDEHQAAVIEVLKRPPDPIHVASDARWG